MTVRLTPPSGKKILEHFDLNDRLMAGVIRTIGPFKLKRNQNYFRVLCNSIIAQQISTQAAQAVTGRFVRLFDGYSPTPERVFSESSKRLRSVGLSRQKTSYLKNLSKHFIDKSIRSHRLPYLSNEEIICQLTAIHGIGRWTAEMFLIFSLNRLNVLPVGDLGLRVAIKKIYNLRERPSAIKIKKLAKSWSPYETIATWYCWRTLSAAITAY